MKLCTYGHPVFRASCKLIEKIDEETRQIALGMIEVMDNHGAIGLAAPQVGLALQLFVLRNLFPLPDGTLAPSAPLVFINPKIVSEAKEMAKDREASPSFPGVEELIERPVAVTIEALDLQGKPFVDSSQGINARIRLHEFEQLHGKLFIDHLPQKKRAAIEKRLKSL